MEGKTLIASKYFQPARLQKITAENLFPQNMQKYHHNKDISTLLPRNRHTKHVSKKLQKYHHKKVSSLAVPSCMSDISKI